MADQIENQEIGQALGFVAPGPIAGAAAPPQDLQALFGALPPNVAQALQALQGQQAQQGAQFADQARADLAEEEPERLKGVKFAASVIADALSALGSSSARPGEAVRARNRAEIEKFKQESLKLEQELLARSDDEIAQISQFAFGQIVQREGDQEAANRSVAARIQEAGGELPSELAEFGVEGAAEGFRGIKDVGEIEDLQELLSQQRLDPRERKILAETLGGRDASTLQTLRSLRGDVFGRLQGKAETNELDDAKTKLQDKVRVTLQAKGQVLGGVVEAKLQDMENATTVEEANKLGREAQKLASKMKVLRSSSSSEPFTPESDKVLRRGQTALNIEATSTDILNMQLFSKKSVEQMALEEADDPGFLQQTVDFYAERIIEAKRIHAEGNLSDDRLAAMIDAQTALSASVKSALRKQPGK